MKQLTASSSIARSICLVTRQANSRVIGLTRLPSLPTASTIESKASITRPSQCLSSGGVWNLYNGYGLYVLCSKYSNSTSSASLGVPVCDRILPSSSKASKPSSALFEFSPAYSNILPRMKIPRRTLCHLDPFLLRHGGLPFPPTLTCCSPTSFFNHRQVCSRQQLSDIA